MIELPAEVLINASDAQGGQGTADLGAGAVEWAKRQKLLARQSVLAPAPRADLGDWKSADVGWGIVLPHRAGMSGRDLARAADAPPAIQQLLDARPGSPVLRYRKPGPKDKATQPDRLIRYYEDGTKQDLTIGNGPFGTREGQLPRYLLLVGGPDEIPWAVQFAANRRHFVGRLALDDAALQRYVDRLLDDWAKHPPDTRQATVWNTSDDPMSLAMEAAIVDPLLEAMSHDGDIAVTRMSGADATAERLGEAIRTSRPGLIATVSHGRTGPVGDPVAMRARLGVPVDASGDDIDVGAIASLCEISGAIWFAYACCSAGCDQGSRFDGLLPEDSSAARIVSAVGTLGATIAPLPQRLLSADPPIAAFIGKIEPTFDWTLAEPDTGENVVLELVDAVYPALFRPETIGLAFSDYFTGVGRLYGSASDARVDMDAEKPDAAARLVYYALTARDRESLVVLGDPTVALPPLR
ncbi:hypothetical protein ACH3VR_11780 [Microbacterium sp. B2969]|uniref:CHAT domain-containing protein n=1 Tax=Microbacterium alkaliflavum TaxID=3248839 RepID=A0ABW7QC36_9MICO